MDWNSRAHHTSRPTATIHSIAADRSGRHSAPAEGGPGSTEGTAAPATTDRLVLTVEEAAYLLNISRTLAYELVARGELPALRLGRRIVIPRATLDELIATAIR
ncbi:MAG TPA: helix-turn-helix domain-containing protein [Acidimicrobiales bacterium]|nr:helix-turn-helix domain-containing protein [Acidimicrobiales bacterium]